MDSIQVTAAFGGIAIVAAALTYVLWRYIAIRHGEWYGPSNASYRKLVQTVLAVFVIGSTLYFGLHILSLSAHAPAELPAIEQLEPR